MSYLQLAHNERHPVSGNPVAKVIHSFGRADKVDRAALARLVSLIARFLSPEQAVTAAAGTGELGGGVEVLDSRRLGAAWTLDRMWERLGVGAAIRRVAADRRLDGDAVERVVFALVAQRACEPGSRLAAGRDPVCTVTRVAGVPRRHPGPRPAGPVRLPGVLKPQHPESVVPAVGRIPAARASQRHAAVSSPAGSRWVRRSRWSCNRCSNRRRNR